MRSLDERWDGSGKPEGQRGAAIPLLSRIALLYQGAEIFHAERGPGHVAVEIGARSGSRFDPDLLRALLRVERQPGFWEPLAVEGGAPAIFAAIASAAARMPVDASYPDAISAEFADVIEAKSPLTA